MIVVIPIGIATIAVFVAERSAGLTAFVAVHVRITTLAGSVRVWLSTRGNQCKRYLRKGNKKHVHARMHRLPVA